MSENERDLERRRIENGSRIGQAGGSQAGGKKDPRQRYSMAGPFGVISKKSLVTKIAFVY
jgi:hypothetical protein